MYISAKQALESHHYNIQIQWYCWWVGNKNLPPFNRLQRLFFFPFNSVLRKARRNVFGYSLYKVLLYRNTNARRLKTFLHMNILQSNCIITSSCYRSCILIFHELGLNIQRIFFFFLSLNCCDEKGHWDIAREEEPQTERERERKTARRREVEKIDRDRVGKKEESRCERERQEQRYCWYKERQRELLFRSDEVQLWVVMCDTLKNRVSTVEVAASTIVRVWWEVPSLSW